jgi:hypothetical protein
VFGVQVSGWIAFLNTETRHLKPGSCRGSARASFNNARECLSPRHSVETLIRGTPADARREVLEILEAFAGNLHVIIGTGDQVGRETPAENLQAMIEAAKRAARTGA